MKKINNWSQRSAAKDTLRRQDVWPGKLRAVGPSVTDEDVDGFLPFLDQVSVHLVTPHRRRAGHHAAQLWKMNQLRTMFLTKTKRSSRCYITLYIFHSIPFIFLAWSVVGRTWAMLHRHLPPSLLFWAFCNSADDFWLVKSLMFSAQPFFCLSLQTPSPTPHPQPTTHPNTITPGFPAEWSLTGCHDTIKRSWD